MLLFARLLFLVDFHVGEIFCRCRSAFLKLHCHPQQEPENARRFLWLFRPILPQQCHTKVIVIVTLSRTKEYPDLDRALTIVGFVFVDRDYDKQKRYIEPDGRALLVLAHPTYILHSLVEFLEPVDIG